MAAGTLELFLLNKESHEAQAEDNRSKTESKQSNCKTNACNRVSTNMIKLRTKNQNEPELVQDH